ncbi:hypothetical protein [Actinomadura miaoliensis]|uniref:Translation initiation factor IF-2 n=1 Tax=Actinomadura miaoliensis TaxID=430685 RepID=A0ABP7VG71_9ACTN
MTAPAKPVFLDVSGRRARLVRRLGLVAGALLTAYLTVLGVNLVAGADVPYTPWPAVKPGTKAPQTENERHGRATVRPTAVPQEAVATPPSGRPAPGTGASPASDGGAARPATSTTSPPTARTPGGSPPASAPGRAPSAPPAKGRDKRVDG